jgi:hypothetical protein
MKAWLVYPGETPNDEGCVLVYAPNKGKAKNIACKKGPWTAADYIDFRARRVPSMDQYHRPGYPDLIERNEDLNPRAPYFFYEREG